VGLVTTVEGDIGLNPSVIDEVGLATVGTKKMNPPIADLPLGEYIGVYSNTGASLDCSSTPSLLNTLSSLPVIK